VPKRYAKGRRRDRNPNWVCKGGQLRRGGRRDAERAGGKRQFGGHEKLQDPGLLITQALIGWSDESDGTGVTFVRQYIKGIKEYNATMITI
jgi:hypothetical protein